MADTDAFKSFHSRFTTNNNLLEKTQNVQCSRTLDFFPDNIPVVRVLPWFFSFVLGFVRCYEPLPRKHWHKRPLNQIDFGFVGEALLQQVLAEGV